jgi:GNAT superfamily N-acetyltransferase
LESDLETTDHRRLSIRPIRPGDASGLVAFHAGLSDRSVYRRYFSSHPMLTSAEVERLTRVDYRDRLGLVVTDQGTLVAVARYERAPGTPIAEVAFLVADGYQHLGIATALLDRLAGAARVVGIAVFEAETMSENRPMLEVFLHSGFDVSTTSEAGTVSVSFPIGTDPGPSVPDRPAVYPDSSDAPI